MAVGKELFKLFGLIGMQGVEDVQKDLKKIDKQVRKTQKEVERLGKRFQETGKTLTKMFTLPLLAAAAASTKMIRDAADLNETMSKTNAIFGEAGAQVEKWSKKSADGFGQSREQAMNAASTFGIFGKSAGLAGKELVKFSTEMVELASDMASFFNTEPQDAIEAIGAAFRGETEPIRRYGVMLDDVTMRQKALEMGLISTTKKALMPQTKVLVARALIMEKTADAQGDFARTSKGLANQERILKARMKDLSATMGQILLPIALKAVDIFSKLTGKVQVLIDWWLTLDESTRTLATGWVILVGAMGPAAFVMGKVIAASRILIPLLAALRSGSVGWAAAMGGIKKSATGVTLVIAALVAVGWYYYSQWETISRQLVAVWEHLKFTFADIGEAIAGIATDVAITLIDIFTPLGTIIPGFEEKLQSAKKEMIKFQATMIGAAASQYAQASAASAQIENLGGLKESIKKAAEEAKKALGITQEQSKALEVKTQKEKEAEEAENKRAASKIEFNKRIADQMSELLDTDQEKLEAQKEADLARAEELGADIFAVKQLYAAKEWDLRLQREAELDRMRKDRVKKEKNALKAGFHMASGFGNKLNNIMAQFSQNRLMRLDNEERRKIEEVQNSQKTEEQKEAAIQKIQEESDRKRKKLEREQAIRQKAAALFNIALNTASAIVEALPNIPLSIAIGALGAAEAVAVASEPMPFFEGGMIQGSQSGVNALVGERNQDELVFPLQRGIDALADGLIDRLANVELPGFAAPEVETAAPGPSVNLNIGTFIGDERGLKTLERKLDTIRIAENQRKGV